MDRSHLTTYSFNCTYAGNTLLLKKGNHRFAVDLATYYGGGEELSFLGDLRRRVAGLLAAGRGQQGGGERQGHGREAASPGAVACPLNIRVFRPRSRA